MLLFVSVLFAQASLFEALLSTPNSESKLPTNCYITPVLGHCRANIRISTEPAFESPTKPQAGNNPFKKGRPRTFHQLRTLQPKLPVLLRIPVKQFVAPVAFSGARDTHS